MSLLMVMVIVMVIVIELAVTMIAKMMVMMVERQEDVSKCDGMESPKGMTINGRVMEFVVCA